MLARWINGSLGAWLAGCAYLLSEGGSPARVTDLADGVALALVSLLAVPGSPALVLGLWMMAAPVAFAYPSPLAAMNAIAVGFAAAAVALHPALGQRRRPAGPLAPRRFQLGRPK